MTGQQGTDWDEWRKCSTCAAETGQACTTLNGRIAAGRPDGVRTVKATPHISRSRRRRRAVRDPEA